jgi:phosphate transport system protein
MIDKDVHSHHISQQFNHELDDIKTRMLEMGGLVQEQVGVAVSAMAESDSGLAEKVIAADKKINYMEVAIDDECAKILARRQPAASDLRLILAISKAISDLERIGDEASKIAKQAVELSEAGTQPKGIIEIRHIGDHVGRMLGDALDSFARLDVDAALAVAKEDKVVDQEYGSALRSLVTYMMEDPRNISESLTIMWALRALERVGDHARNVAEHVIYLVKGENVRHVGLTEMTERVQAD